MRTPIIAANWKMHKSRAEARSFLDAFMPQVREVSGTEILIAPSFTALSELSSVLPAQNVKMAAQNMHFEVEGAFTGEISASMLLELGCEYVILGHSERRQYFSETDQMINQKVKQALESNLTPILCAGETLEERQTNRTEQVLAKQLKGALAGLNMETSSQIVIAYEPVWAIGTGETASLEDAQAGAALIRNEIKKLLNDKLAQGVRIQYGGSVKPENARELLSLPDVDGALVGGASLDPDSFAQIVHAVREGD